LIKSGQNIRTNPAVSAKIIEKLSTREHYKDAFKFLEHCKLDIEDFPTLINAYEENAVYYFVLRTLDNHNILPVYKCEDLLGGV